MPDMLHYFKCSECLHPWAIEFAVPSNQRSYERNYGIRNLGLALCPTCGAVGPHDYMGHVHAKDRVGKLTEKCDCNSLCTFATGPACECRCQGENHGHGMRAVITTTQDNGAISAMFVAAPKTVAAAKARAAEWREMMSVVRERRQELLPFVLAMSRRRADGYLKEDQFRWLIKAGRSWNRVQELESLRTHSGRMKKAGVYLEWAATCIAEAAPFNLSLDEQRQEASHV